MKNRYFSAMRQNGIAYYKSYKSRPNYQNTWHPLYSIGESWAFKYWAIADNYSATDILIDELPPPSELNVFLETFIKAGIKTIVLTNEAALQISLLTDRNCKDLGKCTVFRQESIPTEGKIEIVRGIRIKL